MAPPLRRFAEDPVSDIAVAILAAASLAAGRYSREAYVRRTAEAYDRLMSGRGGSARRAPNPSEPHPSTGTEFVSQ